MILYFVDSGVWIGAFNPKDKHHEEAEPIVTAVTEGEIGKVLITDHIFGEVVTYVRKKMSPVRSSDVAEAMLNSKHVEIAYVDEDTFNGSYHVFQKYGQLSFADATAVVVMRNRGLSKIFSFDSDFDSVQSVTRFTELPVEK